MAKQETISECMWLMVYNFMAQSNYEKQKNWVNGAEQSWFYTFGDIHENVKCLECGYEAQHLEEHLEEVHRLTPYEYQIVHPNAKIMANDDEIVEYRIKDNHLIMGIHEFISTYEGTFLPPLAQVSAYMKKNYSHRELERKERKYKDCEECEDGIRLGAYHKKRLASDQKWVVKEEALELSCECEAGRERTKRGMLYHQWFTDWAKEDQSIIAFWLTDIDNPSLPKEAIISEWRLKQARKRTGGENHFQKAVLGMDAAAKRRDELRISRGEKPVDRVEFVRQNHQVGWYLK
jgi:hypothetical protein|tara:strand:- start:3496 stop:4368 length:873 start_codon:yes stop_codon:yes gene_type:complete